ncbi:hypothetical protein [Actinosynnema sp. NPDC020468]|uniref:hypothetical protein n=1 Tax=Actinosynnema sp. NPDC020468 TaxID=3154488 RepID=UPI0033E593CF
MTGKGSVRYVTTLVSTEDGIRTTTELSGVWRHDEVGTWASMRLRRVPEKGGETRARDTDQWAVVAGDQPAQYLGRLGGWGMNTRVEDEPAFLDPAVAVVAGVREKPAAGTPATRYDLTVTTSAAAARLADEDRRERYGKSGAPTFTASYWIDADGLPVKAVYRWPFRENEEWTTVFGGRGAPVEIAEPPVESRKQRNSDTLDQGESLPGMVGSSSRR